MKPARKLTSDNNRFQIGVIHIWPATVNQRHVRGDSTKYPVDHLQADYPMSPRNQRHPTSLYHSTKAVLDIRDPLGTFRVCEIALISGVRYPKT